MYLNILESLATLCGVLNIYFAVRTHILNWVFGIFMVSIYGIVFFHVKLYADMVLQMVALCLQCYGLKNWWMNDNKVPLAISNASYYIIFLAVLYSCLLFVALAFLLRCYTDSDTIYIDAFTSGASLVTMWMQAKKWIENWFFWIAIDLISIPMYCYKGLYLTAGLYVLFTILSIYGYYVWLQKLKLRQSTRST